MRCALPQQILACLMWGTSFVCLLMMRHQLPAYLLVLEVVLHSPDKLLLAAARCDALHTPTAQHTVNCCD